MTRTLITPTALTANAATAPVTTSVAGLVAPGAAVAARQGGQKLLLVLVNSAGSDKTVTVVAGVDIATAGGAAWMQGGGDLVVTVLANSAAAKYIGPLESARFEQADGTIALNFQSGFTGTVEAYTWPSGF